MVQTGLYKGFSSKTFQHKKTFTTRDFDIVKEDLLNHIFTKRGERVMMPKFGTRIPEMMFEPLDADTIEVITEDINGVFNFDPRVRPLQVQVVPDHDTNSINVVAELFYVELNMTNRFELNIQFNSN
jgi:phage baseplate assembly protein W